jgi:iron complex outermembrane recepter protein
MKLIIITLWLTMSAMTSFAQNAPFKGKVSGMVSDNNNKIVEFATIALLKSKDSSIVKGSVTDANGRFEILNVSAGSYQVRITQMGYSATVSPVFELNENTSSIDLKALRLQEATQTLAEVKVIAAKPFIEQQLDKTVVNVENSVAAAGNTALEVLEKVPGVRVDQNGNISLKGKATVMVLIDGKQTYMGANDLANYLRNMQANQMEKIEVMTNPPAKYEAAGNAGILNIKLKKNQNLGLNGTVSGGVAHGRYAKTNGGFSLNYRNEKVNVFGNVNPRYNKNFQDMNVNRIVSQKNATGRDTMVYFNGITNTINNNSGVNGRLGADYFLNKNTTLGILLTGNTSTTNANGVDNLLLSDIQKTARQRVITSNNSPMSYRNVSGNINLKHSFDTTGRELTMDFDLAKYDNPGKQEYLIETFGINNNTEQLLNKSALYNDQKTVIDIFSGKVDYVHPFNKTTKLEAGWKSSWVKTDNNIIFSNTEGGAAIEGRSNHFIYNENINAVYASFSKEIGKTSFQVGLRMEHTRGNGEQLATKTSFVRDTVNLFPTLYIRQQLSEKHTIGLSYAQRIDRPSYEDLNPFLYYLNDYTFQKGNPYLRPQYTNSIELTHSFMGAINTTIGYSNTSGAMMEAFKSENIDGRAVTYVTRDNFANFKNYSITISFPLPVAKWLTSNNFVGVYHNQFSGRITTINETIDRQGTNLTFNSQNNIKLPKDWGLEVSGFYQSGFIEGQLTGRPMGQVTFGVQKKILDKKATLKLNVSDIFWTNYFRGDFDSPTVKTNVRSLWESRIVRLSFSYRFGNNKVAASRQRNTGLDDEKSRVKNQ